MNNNNKMQALTPHSYPMWIKIGFAMCFSFLFISCAQLPFYFDINKRRKKADIEFKRENFRVASMLYTELSLRLPDNKYFKTHAAKALFKSPREKDHLLGIGLVADLSFTKKEWKEFLQWMPEKYREMCNNSKEKK